MNSSETLGLLTISGIRNGAYTTDRGVRLHLTMHAVPLDCPQAAGIPYRDAEGRVADFHA